MIILPSVIEDTNNGLKGFSITDKLFAEDIIILENEINDDLAQVVKAQLIYLDSKEDTKRIKLYISSGGGSVYAGQGIIDVINYIKTPVDVTCTGMVASMGTQIMASCTGTRSCLKNSRIMIHSVASGTRGKIQDMEIDFNETKYLQTRLMTDLSSYTKGKTSYEEMCKLTERDKWLDANEALEIGLIDKIVS